MNGVDTRRYEMLVRVRDFGVAQSATFPQATNGGKAFAAVAAAVEQLSHHAASEVSGRGSAREGTTSRAVAREALREDLEAITRTARAIALDDPGLDDKFRTPRGNGDQALLSAARAFARDAVPLAKMFTEHVMPEDFLEDLDRSIKSFEEAIRDQEAGKGTHVAARVQIETAMESGLNAVRRLDAIVSNRLRDDTTALVVWNRARRVEYRRPKSDAPPAPEPSAAQAAVAAPAAAPIGG